MPKRLYDKKSSTFNNSYQVFSHNSNLSARKTAYTKH